MNPAVETGDAANVSPSCRFDNTAWEGRTELSFRLKERPFAIAYKGAAVMKFNCGCRRSGAWLRVRADGVEVSGRLPPCQAKFPSCCLAAE